MSFQQQIIIYLEMSRHRTGNTCHEEIQNVGGQCLSISSPTFRVIQDWLTVSQARLANVVNLRVLLKEPAFKAGPSVELELVPEQLAEEPVLLLTVNHGV